MVHLIEHLVPLLDRSSEIYVGHPISAHTILNHADRLSEHRVYLLGIAGVRVAIQFATALRDIHCLVGNTLKIAANLNYRNDLSQIRRNRLKTTKKLDPVGIDALLQFIDFAFVGDSGAAKITSSIDQASHRVAQIFLG